MNLAATLRNLVMPARLRRLLRLNAQITGYWVTQAIYVVAKLGVCDRIGDGAKSAAELAQATHADADALYRVLRALAGEGIFRELPGRRFALTRLGEHLRGDTSGTLRAWAIDNGEPWHWRAWGDILHTVKTGQTALEHTSGARLFGFLERDPDAAAIFDAAMADLATIDNLALVSGYAFGRMSKVVDVGGGNGALLISILRSYPQLRGVLFDRPEVARAARDKIERKGMSARCEVVEGDFFQSVSPAGANAYLLKQVLHDWSDDRAAAILRNCANVMHDDSRLLIVELVVPAQGPAIAKLTDLEMLVMTGGRERTADEYRSLADAAGLRIDKFHATRTPFTIIEMRRRVL